MCENQAAALRILLLIGLVAFPEWRLQFMFKENHVVRQCIHQQVLFAHMTAYDSFTIM